MKINFLFSSFCFLAAAGAVALARAFHPAVFSPHLLTILLTLFAVTAVVYLWHHE